MQIDLDTIDRRVSKVLLLLVPIGFVSALVGAIVRGSDGDRFVMGGLCLAMAAIVGLAAYWQIRLGKTPVRKSTWSSRMRWADKQERPIRYWFTTIMFVICAVGILVYSILFFVFSTEFLGDRGLN